MYVYMYAMCINYMHIHACNVCVHARICMCMCMRTYLFMKMTYPLSKFYSVWDGSRQEHIVNIIQKNNSLFPYYTSFCLVKNLSLMVWYSIVPHVANLIKNYPSYFSHHLSCNQNKQIKILLSHDITHARTRKRTHTHKHPHRNA